MSNRSWRAASWSSRTPVATIPPATLLLRAVAEEARRIKQEFVANVSHELRTPLNMIIGFSRMIVQNPAIDGDQVPSALLADLTVILRNSQHLASLIEDVLDLSQVDPGDGQWLRAWAAETGKAAGMQYAEAYRVMKLVDERNES